MGDELRKATEFNVVRGRWSRGEGISALLRDGKMCCMGFYALACGYTGDNIRHKTVLTGLGSFGRQLQLEVVRGVSNAEEEYSVESDDCVYAQNDMRLIDDAERERRITKLLARRGVTVHFVDDDGEATA